MWGHHFNKFICVIILRTRFTNLFSNHYTYACLDYVARILGKNDPENDSGNPFFFFLNTLLSIFKYSTTNLFTYKIKEIEYILFSITNTSYIFKYVLIYLFK